MLLVHLGICIPWDSQTGDQIYDLNQALITNLEGHHSFKLFAVNNIIHVKVM